jgi:uncharacterized protein
VTCVKVAVSGSAGVIGSALVHRLRAAGHEVLRLVPRRPAAPDEVLWYPELDTERLVGVHAVVHLVGEPLVGRWTDLRRESIRESRVHGTSVLAAGLASMGAAAPKVLLTGSSTWVYGDRGTEPVTEDSPAGVGFLAEAYGTAERAAAEAASAGIRVAHLRYGLVQTPAAGVLARVLPLFRRGVGSRLGSGRQYLSWITIADAVAATAHVLTAGALSGPVNVTAPAPVPQREYADVLAGLLHRPRLVAVPRPALRLWYGTGMADEMLLSGVRALPKRLLDTGFRFRHETLPVAFTELLAIRPELDLSITSGNMRP